MCVRVLNIEKNVWKNNIGGLGEEASLGKMWDKNEKKWMERGGGLNNGMATNP